LTLEGERLLLHALGMTEHCCAFVGQHEAIDRALKQRVAERRLQRSQATTDRGLGLAEPAGCRTERSLARNGEEDARQRLIPTVRTNDLPSPLVPSVMAGLVPAIRRGSVPLLMAGTGPAMTVSIRP
jgi:hypothetical protein